MSLSETLRQLATEFEQGHAHWPELRHILVNADVGTGFDDLEGAQVALFQVSKPTRLIPFSRYIDDESSPEGMRQAFRRMPGGPVDDAGVAPYLPTDEPLCINAFHGIDDRASGRCEAFREFCRLAELAVSLLAESGKIRDPGPLRVVDRYETLLIQDHWVIPLMAVIHGVAHEGRSGSLLRCTATHRFADSALPEWVQGLFLPPTIFVSILPFGVFRCVSLALSSVAAEIEKPDQAPADQAAVAVTQPAIPDRSSVPGSMDSRAVGFAHEMLSKKKRINVSEIARLLEVERTSLYDLPGFHSLVKQDRASRKRDKGRWPKGTKDRKTRTIEAQSSDD